MATEMLIIEWKDRLETRKRLKLQGFISQHTIARKGVVNFKQLRKELKETREIDCIQLCTAGAVTYWYKKDLKIKIGKCRMPKIGLIEE